MDRIKKPLGSVYTVNTESGGVEVKRDYKKAVLDASIIAGIAAVSVLASMGFPPTAEAVYATCIAFILGLLTSLAKRFEIDTD